MKQTNNLNIIYKDMENIYNSPSTSRSPEVFIDYGNNIFRITGRCIMEDAHSFFSDIVEKLKPMVNLKFVVDLEYLNSSSLRHLIFLLKETDTIKEIEWYYYEEDFDVYEKGEDVMEVVLKHRPYVNFVIIEKPM